VWRVGTSIVLIAAALSGASAQKTIVNGGAVLRYHGDTIWMERDTMLIRAIYRGDTVIRTIAINDVVLSSMTYLVIGDGAQLIGMNDRTGAAVRGPLPTTTVPLAAIVSERSLLESALRMQETMARVSSSAMMSRTEPPVFADTVRRYVASSALQLVQYRDTVKYVRGCAGAGRFDTTAFVLFNADSVKRVKPERMFGQAMAVSVVTAMRMALMQEVLKTRSAQLPADLPRMPGPCG
jgi:hypothetical protein